MWDVIIFVYIIIKRDETSGASLLKVFGGDKERERNFNSTQKKLEKEKLDFVVLSRVKGKESKAERWREREREREKKRIMERIPRRKLATHPPHIKCFRYNFYWNFVGIFGQLPSIKFNTKTPCTSIVISLFIQPFILFCFE